MNSRFSALTSSCALACSLDMPRRHFVHSRSPLDAATTGKSGLAAQCCICAGQDSLVITIRVEASREIALFLSALLLLLFVPPGLFSAIGDATRVDASKMAPGPCCLPCPLQKLLTPYALGHSMMPCGL